MVLETHDSCFVLMVNIAHLLFERTAWIEMRHDFDGIIEINLAVLHLGLGMMVEILLGFNRGMVGADTEMVEDKCVACSIELL